MPARAPNARTRASPSSWPPSPRICRPVTRALLAGTGFEPVRHFFLMRNPDLGAVPEVPLPEGFELRRVVEADRQRIIEAENEAFRDHFGHREMTANTYTQTYDRPELDTDLWVVAWAGDEIAGVVQNWIWPEENERLGVKRGWLEHISVAGRGAGAAWPGPSPRRPGPRLRTQASGRDAGQSILENLNARSG